MAVTNRGSILISTANDIGSSLVDVIGGEGYTPNEWSKEINLCGIAAADVPTALENIEESTPSGTDRGSISLDTANAVGAVLNKKFNTARGFKPSEWASAISKLTELEVKTASGSVASFDDGADDVPLKSCTCEIVPQQDLHGYANPWAPGAGSNKWDEQYELGGLDNSGADSPANDRIRSKNYIPVTAETAYYFLKPSGETTISWRAFFYDDTYTFISYIGTYSTSRSFNTPANAKYMRFWVLVTSYNNDIAVNYPDSVTTWSPYSNICPITGTTEIEVTHTDGQTPPIESETRSVEFNTPIYSGSAEILGGNGLANGRKKIKDFGNWVYVPSNTGYFQVLLSDMKAPVDNNTPLSGLYCEAYKTGSASDAGSRNVNGTIAGVIVSNNVSLRIKNNAYSDVNDFIRDFGDYYVVYPLVTSDPFTFEPATEISSYLGDNNISSDVQGGTTTVEYRADIDLAAT